MKPYFKSPLHLTIFFIEITLIFVAIGTFVQGAIAYFMGYHHGFHTFLDSDEFALFLRIAVPVFTLVFFIDLIIFIVRKMPKRV